MVISDGDGGVRRWLVFHQKTTDGEYDTALDELFPALSAIVIYG